MNATAVEIGEYSSKVLDRVGRAVVGKREELSLVLAGILAGGHVLLEDLPGLGKTLAARSFAQVLGLDFRRLQFTPDLLPADVTGAYIYNQRTATFEFRPGPIFTNLLLADEVNRTPPRTQAALLEAMQERQVTVEGVTSPLQAPFHVLATSNPIEYEGTYQLPEAQLDRFLLRVSFGYPTHDEETEILVRRLTRRHEEQVLDQVTDSAGLLAMQGAIEAIEIDRSILEYIVSLVDSTRDHPEILVGASPRGALAITLCARARAAISGRDFVTPDDVKAVAPSALGHRVALHSESYLRGSTATSVIQSLLDSVPVPATTDLPSFVTDAS